MIIKDNADKDNKNKYKDKYKINKKIKIIKYKNNKKIK